MDGQRTASATAVGVLPSPGARAATHWIGFALVGGALASIPAVGDLFFTGLIGKFLVFGLAAMALDLVWGYTGQLSLGHAAFFGLGAYACGLVLAKTTWPAAGLIALGLGVAVPAALALLMAVTLFYGRVAGAYFAIITLIVSLILERLAVSMLWLTGGINGLYGFRDFSLGFLVIDSRTEAYYAALIACLGAYVGARLLVSSPFGRSMDAVRVNEPRTASLGYSTAAIKTVVFTLSGALAGLAGVLYVPLESFVYPSQLGIIFSTSIVVWVAVGGRRSLVGPFIGAFVINYVQSLLSDRLEQYWVLATGLLLLLVVMTQPGGVLGVLRWMRRRIGEFLARGMRRA
jgi:urea ABC transporter permease protein UrtC